MRAERLRVEGNVAGGEFFANAFGQGLKGRVGCDAEPKGRVGRTPELSQAVGRKRNRGRASASHIEGVHGPTCFGIIDVAEEGQRQMVGAAVEKTSLQRRA